MAILRFKNVEDAPADGQAVQLVHIDGLDGSGGGTSITDVEVTTLSAGSDATASIEGTTLKLGIPKGDKGDTGADGAAGATGATGPAGVGVKAISLTVTEGSVTAGTWTDTSDGPHAITINGGA